MVSQPGSSGEWTVYMNFDEGANMDQVSNLFFYVYYCITFSSPGPKAHLRYCHRLAFVSVCSQKSLEQTGLVLAEISLV